MIATSLIILESFYVHLHLPHSCLLIIFHAFWFHICIKSTILIIIALYYHYLLIFTYLFTFSVVPSLFLYLLYCYVDSMLPERPFTKDFESSLTWFQKILNHAKRLMDKTFLSFCNFKIGCSFYIWMVLDLI